MEAPPRQSHGNRQDRQHVPEVPRRRVERRRQFQQQLADEYADGIRKKSPPEHDHRATSKIEDGHCRVDPRIAVVAESAEKSEQTGERSGGGPLAPENDAQNEKKKEIEEYVPHGVGHALQYQANGASHSRQQLGGARVADQLAFPGPAIDDSHQEDPDHTERRAEQHVTADHGIRHPSSQEIGPRHEHLWPMLPHVRLSAT